MYETFHCHSHTKGYRQIRRFLSSKGTLTDLLDTEYIAATKLHGSQSWKEHASCQKQFRILQSQVKIWAIDG